MRAADVCGARAVSTYCLRHKACCLPLRIRLPSLLLLLLLLLMLMLLSPPPLASHGYRCCV